MKVFWIVKILMFVAMMSYNLSGVLWAKQPLVIGGTVNAGYTGFSGSWTSKTNGVLDFEWDDVTGLSVPINVLVHGAYGLNDWFSVGGVLGFGVGVDSDLGTPKYTVNGTATVPLVESVVGGFRIGPYFRFGLWGKDKGGGIAVAALFMIDSFREPQRYSFYTGSGYLYLQQKGVSVAGLALMSDIFINRYFGVNVGLVFSGLTSDGNFERVAGNKLELRAGGVGFLLGASFSVPIKFK